MALQHKIAGLFYLRKRNAGFLNWLYTWHAFKRLVNINKKTALIFDTDLLTI
jgi:hypothetical protein